MKLVSLRGLNNLRKLQYDIETRDLSQIHQQLQTIPSTLITEVNFIYGHDSSSDNSYKVWCEIDTLMIKNLPTLSIVTIEWRVAAGGLLNPWEDKPRVTWDHSISQSVAALPKLHQKGILRPLLPPQEYPKYYPNIHVTSMIKKRNRLSHSMQNM